MLTPTRTLVERSPFTVAWVVPVAFLLLVACGDDPTGTEPDPAIGLSVSPEQVEVEPGGTASVTVEVARTDFEGAVTVGVSGLPSGVTASSLTLDGGLAVETATLELDASADAPAGTASATVEASASGVSAVTASLEVSVLPSGNFSLSLEPESLELQQGGSGEVSVSISRSGDFEGEVALSVEDLPFGVAGAFEPEATDGESSTLTLQAADGAEVGSANATVTGEATELGTREVSLGIEVTEAPDAQTVSFGFCESSGLPQWFAVQDGDGDWQRVEPEVATQTEHEYVFELESGRGGIAWFGAEPGADAELHLFYGSAEELGHGMACEPEESPLRTVSGAVVGVDAQAGEMAQVSLGGQHADMPSAGSGGFTIEHVPQGPQDLLAARVRMEGMGTGEPSSRVDRLLVRRGVDPPEGEQLDRVDFDSEEAFDPAEAEVALENLNGETGFVNVQIVTAAGQLAVPSFDFSTDAVRSYQGLPTERQTSGDAHVLGAMAIEMDEASGEGTVRFSSRSVAAVENTSLALGPHLTAQVSAGTLPSASFSAQPEYEGMWIGTFAQERPDREHMVGVVILSGYVEATAGTVELSVPDLSDVEGWDPDWGLETGSEVTWVLGAASASLLELVGNLSDPTGAVGISMQMATEAGSFTP